jgi:hypothetical protein
MPRQRIQPDDKQKPVGGQAQNSAREPVQKEARTKERVQLDFAPEALERLDQLKELTGASTRAEIIRQALRLYEWFVIDIDPNDTLTVTNDDDKIKATFKAKLLHNSTKSV